MFTSRLLALLFGGIFGFDESFQVVQAGSPEDAILLDPVIDGAEGFGIELIDAMAAVAILADKMSAAEQAQVFGDGRSRNWKSAGNLPRRPRAAAEKIEDGAARGIGKSLEGRLR